MKCGLHKNVNLSKEQYDKLNGYYLNTDELIERLSDLKKRENKKYKRDYVAILCFAKGYGIEK